MKNMPPFRPYYVIYSGNKQNSKFAYSSDETNKFKVTI